LLRWDDEEFGSTAPNEIIPLAEETGLIHQLTDWSVWRAGRDLRTVRAGTGIERPFPFGINLSCAQLSSPSLVDRYLAAVAAVGFEPQDFVVEVTETELVEEDSMAERSLLALANAGTLIAIDDFGAGYSSFDYLTRMPVDFLKIDRRLTRALPANARARRVLGALVTMCLDMGVALIGEGIETEAERTAYLDIGIQYGQGFLFRPGIGVDELVADLRAEVRAGR
ncbi:MAG: EAL domain-containing protein, partial [Acidimicrobiales bacterium]|nr:EAL domain-containing protein [Acidimicrobiales bacterium]